MFDHNLHNRENAFMHALLFSSRINLGVEGLGFRMQYVTTVLLVALRSPTWDLRGVVCCWSSGHANPKRMLTTFT